MPYSDEEKQKAAQNEYEEKRRGKRSRNWWAILYPDDLPEDWLDRIRSIGCRMLLSPLHDKDLWTVEDEKKNPKHVAGTPKKKHYHLAMFFESMKSIDQIDGIFKSLFDTVLVDGGKAVAIPGVMAFDERYSKIHDRASAVRYLAHMDHPEKAQYKVEDIMSINGADLQALLVHTEDEISALMVEMEKFIMAHMFTELADFSAAIREIRPDWYRILTRQSTYYFTEYLKSVWRKLEKAKANGGVIDDH